MPRRHRKTMKGGFLDTLTNWGSSLTQSASNLWEKTKQATSSLSSSATSNNSPPSYATPSNNSPPSYATPTNNSPPSYGGKTRRKRRMRGGFKDNTTSSSLAANSASFSGETAKPHNLVGGRTRRHKKRGKKSHRRR